MDERLMEEGTATDKEQTTLDIYNERLQDSSNTGNNWLLSETTPQDTSPRLKPPDPEDLFKKKNTKNNDDPYKGYVNLCISGLALMVVAYLLHYLDPIQTIKDFNLNMKEGTYLYRMWKSPPIKIYIKVFIFNITNAALFIKGHDKKLKVVEVGPYTYSETMTNERVVWNPNKTISFSPVRKVQFEPALSVGNPETDLVQVPNIPLLGIASLLQNSSMGLNLGVSTLVSYLDSQPILNLTVSSFLWGYEDPLVRLASNWLPSWINFDQFGLLDRMMDEGKNRITMSLAKTNLTNPFEIENLNGSPGLKQWGYDPNKDKRSNHCNRVEGATEGYMYPSNIQKNQTFTIYRRAFCRPLTIEFDRAGLSSVGYPIYIYKFADRLLDPSNPDNACYCKQKSEGCLPQGLADLSPCYYGFPVALSQPHFLNGSDYLSKGVEGVSPDFEKHSSSIGIQPDSGVPVFVRLRLQTNLVLKKTKFISRVRPFNNLIIPVFWMQVEVVDLPMDLNLFLFAMLKIGPIVEKVSILALFALGLVFVFFANLRYAWRSGIFNSRRRATIISFRQKQKQQEKIIWRNSKYSQLMIAPPQPTQELRTR